MGAEDLQNVCFALNAFASYMFLPEDQMVSINA